MAKPSDHPKFKELKKQWDHILLETGFEDHEDAKGNLKQTTAGIYSRYGGRDQVSRKAKADFFAKVSEHIARTRFPTRLDRVVMEAFAEGIKQVDICERTAAYGIHNRWTIWRIIRKWLKKWNLK